MKVKIKKILVIDQTKYYFGFYCGRRPIIIYMILRKKNCFSERCGLE
jgi:hypothetical protein